MVLLKLSYRKVVNVLFIILNSLNMSNSLSKVHLDYIWLSISDTLVSQTFLSPITPFVQVLCQLSSLTIDYHNIGFD